MRVPQQPTYHRLVAPRPEPSPEPPSEPGSGPGSGSEARGGHRWPLWLALAVAVALLVTAATGWLLHHGVPRGSTAQGDPRAPRTHAFPVTDIDR
ncbi:hypothetical protein [Streptomyces radicis]|uniref:Uncharacterized protein n=1 Tax=Streptomyces radicis TaxID=1750517 RepID=A0A3A9W8S1_9ACTN|nr:hypothetical protein [Streptomyces radicis]RKN08743.1 hypothetical protein D7319_15270 [Streptomyces radicis]RKN21901.1 hypothetical protein D7318_16225 [Streptomyces radicis]